MANILYIYGDPIILEARKAFLEGKGYNVLIARNAGTGIELSRRYSIDAVVLDIKPTETDLNQVADLLAKEQPNLPVAISSDSPDDLPEPLKWYADVLLQQREAPEALLCAIENFIASRIHKKVPSREAFVGSEAA